MPGPVREFARTLLSFVLTRTRLAATELEEQGVRLIEILIWFAVALFFFGIAIVFAAVVVVLLFWDSNRLLAAGLLAAAPAPRCLPGAACASARNCSPRRLPSSSATGTRWASHDARTPS